MKKPAKLRVWRKGLYSVAEATDLLGSSYTLIQTRYSTRAETERASLCWSARPMGLGLLRLIGMFRAHVLKRVAEEKITHPQRVPWGSAAWEIKTGEQYEVDLKAAYAHAALAIGAIDPAWLARLLRISRHSRLAIVGSLATVKHVSEIRDGKVIERHTERDFKTGKVYQSIRAKTDEIMDALAWGKGWYWVDAQFQEEKLAGRIHEAAGELGFPAHPPERVVVSEIRGRRVILEDGRFFYPRRLSA